MSEITQDIQLQRAIINGVWIFIGIVAGTIVNLLISIIQSRVQHHRIKRNIKFETQFNIAQIDKWEKDFDEIQKASNGDNLQDCHVFINLQRMIFWTVNVTIANGSVYNYLDKDSIAKLQEINDFYTKPFMTKTINDMIKGFKTKSTKQEVTKKINFWKTMLGTHKNMLKKVESSL